MVKHHFSLFGDGQYGSYSYRKPVPTGYSRIEGPPVLRHFPRLDSGLVNSPPTLDTFQVSKSVIRPSGETAVASVITRAAPPIARLPRCTRCQSVGIPSTAEYWHIGETKIRFLNTSSLRRRGENRSALFMRDP